MDDLALIIRALSFAAARHRDQRRKDPAASPYINHPIALADVLVNEAGVRDPEVIAAAILHDTLEDTATTPAEIEAAFGPRIRAIVEQVSDDKRLSAEARKRAQVEHAAEASDQAKLVKLADKICNLRDVRTAPPVGWTNARRQAYLDWGKAVVDRLRGVHPVLESLFDQEYRAGLETDGEKT